MRWRAAVAVVGFHLFNFVAFDIGIFPWLMLATLPLFFSLRCWERVNQRGVVPSMPRETEAGMGQAPGPLAWRPRHRLITALVIAYAAAQALVPLRHVLYPGTVHWTEEGHRFAWHMMLRTKSGSASFR